MKYNSEMLLLIATVFLCGFLYGSIWSKEKYAPNGTVSKKLIIEAFDKFPINSNTFVCNGIVSVDNYGNQNFIPAVWREDLIFRINKILKD